MIQTRFNKIRADIPIHVFRRWKRRRWLAQGNALGWRSRDWFAPWRGAGAFRPFRADRTWPRLLTRGVAPGWSPSRRWREIVASRAP